MAVITIHEEKMGTGCWYMSVRFNGGPPYMAVITDPFTAEQERELEWYFEEHLAFPMIEQVRARQAAESIRRYGEDLFKEVFADRNAYSQYMHILAEGLPTIQVEIEGSPAFHGLHWEAVKDPALPQALALQATVVRKNLVPAPISAQIRPSPVMNILVMTARPGEAHDVGYRTISRPLLDALHRAQVPVQIDLVRPGTYEALVKHLQKVTMAKGVGYYHLIHFDVHGGLLTYQDFQASLPEATSQYVYQRGYGRNDLAPYEGKNAFLFFEAEDGESADPAMAEDVAALVQQHQVPVVILNACQSGKQVGATETSLGSRLMQAGVQLVVAMGYSVTVSAAMILMQNLYPALFAQQEFTKAITQARQELAHRKERLAYFRRKIDLEDWLLPVVYQNRPIQLQTRPMTPEEKREFVRQEVQYYHTFGFWGRDLDVLRIEKRLLSRMDHNIVLICGMGGAGKTTLLQHLGSWWQRTGLIKRVWHFGYDEKSWTRQQIMRRLAQELLSSVEYVSSYEPLSPEEKQFFLARRLRAEQHLLILDNLESITGTALAIRHTLSPGEQQKLRGFLKALRGGNTLVLLGSRSREAWLAPETFEDNVHELGGLDPEAASHLTESILERCQATRYRRDPALQRLLELLQGYPLALEVVLTNLRRQTPAEVLQAVRQPRSRRTSGSDATPFAMYRAFSEQSDAGIAIIIGVSCTVYLGDR